MKSETATVTPTVDIERKTRTTSAGNREALEPSSPVAYFGPSEPLHLDAGIDLSPIQIAYNTYGELNEDRSNAILVCHALTGDHYAASQ